MVYITLPLLRERRNGALHSEPFTLYIEKMRYLYYFDNKDRQMPAFLKKKKKKNRMLFTIRTHFVEV